jgi:hypothetical protein
MIWCYNIPALRILLKNGVSGTNTYMHTGDPNSGSNPSYGRPQTAGKEEKESSSGSLRLLAGPEYEIT